MKYYEDFEQLSKEQLIYLISELDNSQFLISEVCVDESKMHISSDKAVRKIREYIYYVPYRHNIEHLKAYIDVKIGKISELEFLRIIGLED